MISTTELGTCVAVCKVLAPFRSTAKMQATIAVPNGFSWAISAIAMPSKPKPEPKPLITPMCENGFHVISRFRNDVVLYYPTLEQKTGKRGPDQAEGFTRPDRRKLCQPGGRECQHCQQAPASIRPVATVPRPVIENTSSTGIKNGLSTSRGGRGIQVSTASISSMILSSH